MVFLQKTAKQNEIVFFGNLFFHNWYTKDLNVITNKILKNIVTTILIRKHFMIIWFPCIFVKNPLNPDLKRTIFGVEKIG